ncbi:MAG: prolyl oligopeptidase family serine peptidase [Elusimicrobia bacterium]|nr:prolyl oligopeptidase family serine peptidase [Elusimicrobiota bacterium]
MAAWPLLALLALSAHAGFAESSVESGGLRRTYSVYAPQGKKAPLPALFVLHGGKGGGAQMRKHTERRFEALADERGLLVVYPDGADRHWNDGRRQPGSRDVDDVGFLAALADSLVKSGAADPARLYAVGISNGGFMAHALACRDAGRWAAVSAVVASLGEALAPECRPSRPVSVLMVNGTEDRLIPWDGRDVRFLWKKLGRKLTVPETAARWTELDGCSGEPERSELPDPVDDGTRWSLEARRACRGGAEVLLYKVQGGGHTWPNGTPYLKRVVGRTSRDVDFERLVTDFFLRHPKEAP